MREEGINDVTIFRSSRYLYVGAGLEVGQTSVSQIRSFLIFSQIVCRDFPSIHTLARQQFTQNGRPSKLFFLNHDILIGIYEQCGISYIEYVTVLSGNVSSVEMAAAVVKIWQYVRGCCGDDILPTERPCISLDKKLNIITFIIVFVVVVDVTDFSESEPRLRRLVCR